MKVLVLGGTGMLGHMTCRILAGDHDVHATVRAPLDPTSPGAALLADTELHTGVDAGDPAALEATVAAIEPDVVVNCIGIVKQLAAANDAVASITINSLLPHQLAEAAERHGFRLIHVSTDCVFSGTAGGYNERDVPDPVDLYGRSKLLGELGDAEGLTLRTSIVGRQIAGHTSLFEWVLSNRGQTVRGFDRAVYSGLTTMALAEVIGALIVDHRDLSGLWHVASAPITKFELIGMLDAALELGLTIERDTTFRCDRSLDGGAFVQATGIEVPSWATMIDEFAADQVNYPRTGTHP